MVNIGVKRGISIPNLEGNSEQSKGYTSRQDIYGRFVSELSINQVTITATRNEKMNERDQKLVKVNQAKLFCG